MKYVKVPFSLIGSTDIDEKMCDDLITWFEEVGNLKFSPSHSKIARWSYLNQLHPR